MTKGIRHKDKEIYDDKRNVQRSREVADGMVNNAKKYREIGNFKFFSKVLLVVKKTI